MTDRAQQQEIIEALGVPQNFEVAAETERRIAFLADYLERTGAKGYVLGISGGVDSSTAGRLAQLAVERVRERGGDARFIAIRLPYQVQFDEEDAQRALAFIRADEQTTINVGPATDAMWAEVMASDATPDESTLTDFVKGNVKARQRMIAQYTVAGARGMLVIGTDQGAEAIVGFFTKFGDGAADLLPLAGLPKRRVKQIAAHLGAEDRIVNKVPTADLETDKPLLPDEQALGVRYEDVDDYLEGKDISAEAEAKILDWYRRTAHKRALPVTPDDV
ncbi:ammonia-dependent NAD(+) synthetase [Epidermidibacterium keratini]|uniref:NH(3)-dependent NAD(+) synthetase n=1 Tax=Epidermidibacterium keratini TaxID=1891644 RepID=A0A7L4YN95_9ACTN|nr:ammonia-dependent NAD(+) synthetase [Epidermidibacterium keratini]QHC00548.1 ammonia-dependent NAD(+) synthetase [Epidermidibacterium keratini]